MLEALAPAGGVIAMITGIDGAFYRPLGALMAFPTSADPVGSLSSGCIEGDLALMKLPLKRNPCLLRKSFT